MSELLLDLAGLLAVICLALLACYLGFGWLAKAFWQRHRKGIADCAAKIADCLSLLPARVSDARMECWQGQVGPHAVWLATGALYEGPTGEPLDRSGPGFFNGSPRIAFKFMTGLVVIVRFSPPLPATFRLSSLYAAPVTLYTGDRVFDGKFKLDGEVHESVVSLFADSALRASLLAVFGDGTGIMLAANECGMAVWWDRPRLPRAIDFARAVEKATHMLGSPEPEGEPSGHQRVHPHEERLPL